MHSVLTSGVIDPDAMMKDFHALRERINSFQQLTEKIHRSTPGSHDTEYLMELSGLELTMTNMASTIRERFL